jgi:hypothetical protein
MAVSATGSRPALGPIQRYERLIRRGVKMATPLRHDVQTRLHVLHSTRKIVVMRGGGGTRRLHYAFISTASQIVETFLEPRQQLPWQRRLEDETNQLPQDARWSAGADHAEVPGFPQPLQANSEVIIALEKASLNKAMYG